MRLSFALLVFAFFSLLVPFRAGAALAPPTYDMGSPVLEDIWVDPVQGNDERTGASRAEALRSITAAWERIPNARPLTRTGYRLQLVRGTYDEHAVPAEGILFGKHGTKEYPIVFHGVDGPGTVTITRPLNLQDNRFLYLINIDIRSNPGGGNVIQLANSKDILWRYVRVLGGRGPSETVKGNQIQRVYLEHVEVTGGNLGLDLVAAQYGHIVDSRFSDSDDWCLYLKGGTAYFHVEGNEIFNCRGGGAVTIANATAYDYLVSPWIHYEAYDVSFVNNVVRDSPGSGLGIFGGYNILAAHNTFYNVGTSETGHGLVTVGFGNRPCLDDFEYAQGTCREKHQAGGWGPPARSSGDAELIPNKHIFIYNNIFYNRAPQRSRWSHLVILGERAIPGGNNIPSPIRSDDDLQIRGNIIWNQGSDLGLGEGSGCQSSNPTCNEAQLLRDNIINTLEPQFQNVSAHDFRVSPVSNISSARTSAWPDFTWSQVPVRPRPPEGRTRVSVARDKDGQVRTGGVGAYVAASSVAPVPPSVFTPKLVKLRCSTMAPVGVDHPCRAVYYVDSFRRRHAFPNEKVYFTWYVDFSTVEEVDQAALAAFPLGKNVVYRPSVRLVKFVSVPQVYAVARAGVLRWVTTEELARQLYGGEWGRMVDDISDAFYADYSFGPVITSSEQYHRAEELARASTIERN